jgi:hypothetical protein
MRSGTGFRDIIVFLSWGVGGYDEYVQHGRRFQAI